MRIGEAIRDGVTAVTKDWTTVKRKTLRDAARGARAWERYWRGVHKEESTKAIAFRVMPAAYEKASGHGAYPATARQVMYAARPLILEETSKPLGKDFDKYFTQHLLPTYQQQHPERTAGWDVVYDARGHFIEPHTETSIALGTLQVRTYLSECHHDASASCDPVTRMKLRYPTSGPSSRYRNVLFLEKEGFNDLLAAAQIAARFDVAIMSTKGYSSTAARTLIEQLNGVRILVLHDFDKDGLGILYTLQHDTVRYQFDQPPEILDLGIRLADITAEQLQSEPVRYSKNPVHTLRKYGATAEELEVLCPYRDRGARVELNAFASDHFIAWLERKLTQHGVTKVVPDAETLADAYRRALKLQYINRELEGLEADAETVSARAPIPESLAEQVAAEFKAFPMSAWDDAIAVIAGSSGDPVTD